MNQNFNARLSDIQSLDPRVAEIHSVSELLAMMQVPVNHLRIKLGMDPTAPDVTLGHAVPLLIARQFQEWGHKVILIIGDFTAKVGDPSGVDKTRPMLTPDEITRNAYTYIDQIGRILLTDQSVFEVRRNSEWLSQVNIVDLASRKTVQQMLARDSFKQRFQKGQDIRVHEFLYPLFQAWDSVHIRADVELGGSYQLFNMMLGREMQQGEGMRPQCVICTPLLVGLDGKQKMSKSKGNYVGVCDPPEVMFSKLMSLPDDAMPMYYQLLLGWKSDVTLHPREQKANLAHGIVTWLHNESAADSAEQHFNTVHRDKLIPEDIPKSHIRSAPFEFDLTHLVSFHFNTSRTLAVQKINEGAIKLDGEKVTDPKQKFSFQKSAVLQFGKRRFIRLVPDQ